MNVDDIMASACTADEPSWADVLAAHKVMEEKKQYFNSVVFMLTMRNYKAARTRRIADRKERGEFKVIQGGKA